MTPADLAALHAAAFAHERPWTEAEFAGLLAGPGIIVTGDARAVVLGRVIADEAEVLTLATAPAHRRRGLARAALADFEAEAARRGATTAFLEVAEDNTAARALYRGAGYVETGRRPAYYRRHDSTQVAALTLSRRLAGLAHAS